jgi:hypothetical protein
MADIVEWLCDAIRDPECPVQFSPMLMAARNEIVRLRGLRELDAKEIKMLREAPERWAGLNHG